MRFQHFQFFTKSSTTPKKYKEVSQRGTDFKTMAMSAMISVATLSFLIPHLYMHEGSDKRNTLFSSLIQVAYSEPIPSIMKLLNNDQKT